MTPKFKTMVDMINRSEDIPETKKRDILSRCEVFLFCREETTEPYPDSEDIPALPFQTIYVEIINGQLANLENHSTGLWPHTTHVAAMIVNEVTPDVLEYFILMEMWQVTDGKLFSSHMLLRDVEDIDIVNHLMYRINYEVEGVEKVRKSIKIGKGKFKILRRVKRVIHISPKKACTEVEPVQSGRSIDWSHSWLVRGHWRKVAEVGKNRNGDYCVSGKTFVESHAKGQGFVHKKTRIVTTPPSEPKPYYPL